MPVKSPCYSLLHSVLVVRGSSIGAWLCTSAFGQLRFFRGGTGGSPRHLAHGLMVRPRGFLAVSERHKIHIGKGKVRQTKRIFTSGCTRASITLSLPSLRSYTGQ